MRLRLLGTLLLTFPSVVSAQLHPAVAEARAAFEGLDYARAIQLAQAALGSGLAEADMAEAYEVLGYAYGILSDEDRAVANLSQMLVIDPDREPPRETLPPRISSLHGAALGQVLVLRGVLVDSVSFVGGQGQVVMHYQVSRPSRVDLRVIGNGVDTTIRSGTSNPGLSRFDWPALIEGIPVPEGDYQLLVTAEEGRSQYQRLARFRVEHAPVDTTRHDTLEDMLAESEQYRRRPETEIPPRDWRPLGVTTLLTGAAAGAALALSNSAFNGNRLELGIGAAITLGSGLWLSLQQPEPRPVQLAIDFNRVVDQTLADRNARIARDNALRRQQVRLTIVQVGS